MKEAEEVENGVRPVARIDLFRDADPGRADRAPIGVFDSGIGGLSILREIRRELPHEDLIYVADSAYTPYGDRSADEVASRARVIADVLRTSGAKALVVACNTASSVAVDDVRTRHPVPVVAVEPAIKPAVVLTRSGVVGVMATSRTLTGSKFAGLVSRHAADVEVVAQPCPGLVERVEAGDLDGAVTRALVERYVGALVEAGADTIVLGCTHYPFLIALVREVAGPSVVVLDSAAPVARQLRQRLVTAHLMVSDMAPGTDRFWTSGRPDAVRPVLERLWGRKADVTVLVGPAASAREGGGGQGPPGIRGAGCGVSSLYARSDPM